MMYSKWLSLSLETRNKIALAFDIQKKGSTEVFSNTIKSDGYFVQDIETALTVKAMQDYLASKETDKDVLFEMIVDVMEGKVKPEVSGTIAPEEVKASGTFDKIEVMPTEPKKKSVTKKKATTKKAVVKKAVTKVIKKKK